MTGGLDLRYRVYGITLDTDVQLAVHLPPSDGEVDLRFELLDAAPDGVDPDAADAVYVERAEDADGAAAAFTYWSLPDRDVVRIGEAMDFHCWADRVVCHLRAPRYRYLVEVTLFGMVLALWLERHGTPTLHGAAVAIDGRAVAFLATSGTGKTSTAAAFIAEGLPMLSEDLLAIERRGDRLLVHPAYPQLRMWPAQAQHFFGRDDFPRAHPARDKLRVDVDAFQPDPLPLARIYVLERAASEDQDVRLAPIRPRHAIMELIGHSFLPVEVARFGLAAQRFAFLAGVVRTVPILRLTVPVGLERLPEVVAAVGDDVRGTAT